MSVFVNLFWDFQFICLFGGVFYKNTMLVSMCLRCFLYELSGLIIDQVFSEVLWKRPGLSRCGRDNPGSIPGVDTFVEPGLTRQRRILDILDN